jgi:hypothetical protein
MHKHRPNLYCCSKEEEAQSSNQVTGSAREPKAGYVIGSSPTIRTLPAGQQHGLHALKYEAVIYRGHSLGETVVR